MNTTLELIKNLLSWKIPTRRDLGGEYATQSPLGHWIVQYKDETGLMRGAKLEDYDRMMAGKRKVKFVANGDVLYETDFNHYLDLIAERV